MRRAILSVIVACLLLAPGAPAADADDQAIRTTLEKATANWSAMNPDANDAYYAADADIVWFDIAPMQYKGWSAYKEGAKKLFATLDGVSLKLNDDVVISRRGKIAWATYTFTAELRMKGGKVEKGEGRGTDILEKRGGKWMVVHEHVSFPAPM
jgi:DNA phosphorothioation-dependent restriction protein DptG